MSQEPLVPGVSHVDHIGLTVPDLEAAVEFFVRGFGAEELYRSQRGPDPDFMETNFGAPRDSKFELAMLRMPPNLNIELFEWQTVDQGGTTPRPNDLGGHHLCFEVEDVDAAIAALRGMAGVVVFGERKEVAADSPLVAGNRWTYLRTPWGLVLELVDRSRVKDPPNFVGPPDWQ